MPLALLAVLIGVLVMGSFQGQVAAANARQGGYRAGGLALSVDTMLWLMNMGTSAGYQMPASEMPNMQRPGDDRLRIEVTLGNITGSAQEYSTTDFTVTAPGGKTWKVNGQEHSIVPVSAYLRPGFQATVDVYFDIPAKQSRNLTLHWSRGGTTVSIPVDTSVMPRGMKM